MVPNDKDFIKKRIVVDKSHGNTWKLNVFQSLRSKDEPHLKKEKNVSVANVDPESQIT